MTQRNRHKVTITPLVSNGVYGDPVDVSDYCSQDGISRARRHFDQGDYDVGKFDFGGVTMRLDNSEGTFSPSFDGRSIFRYTRDKAKVAIEYFDEEGVLYYHFNGIIQEEATKVSSDTGSLSDEIKFVVGSLESVTNALTIRPGAVAPGSTLSAIIKQLLSAAEVQAVLTYSASNINVGLDLAIDANLHFDSMTYRDALEELLFASGSILTVDSTGTVHVSTRMHDPLTTPTPFYGSGSGSGLENLLMITKYNDGLHRAINTCTINGYTYDDLTYVQLFGARVLERDLGFITSSSKALQIARNLVDEFKAPKVELEIMAPASDAVGLDLLDLVTLDTRPLVKGVAGEQPPAYGVAVYGGADYPYTSGGVKIFPDRGFKITEISHNIGGVTTNMRLREIGTTMEDGYL